MARHGKARQGTVTRGEGDIRLRIKPTARAERACVPGAPQSTSHTKPGMLAPAICQNMSIFAQGSVWHPAGMNITKAGLGLDWSD